MYGQKNCRPDEKSDCRSFGSNYHPCSQSRKISIGVTADSQNTRAKKVSEAVAVAPTKENITSSQRNTSEDRPKENVGIIPEIGKQTEVLNQESPWISTQSLHQKVPFSVEANNSEQASRPPARSSMLNRSNGIKEAMAAESVQFFEKQVSTLQDKEQKKFCRRKNEKVGRQDGASVTAQEALVPEKEVIEDKAKKTESLGNETLKMKLWEILGTVASPVKHPSSLAPETGTRNLKLVKEGDDNVSPIVKPKQNCVTIGNDSNSPNHTIRRPVTRSWTRRRTPTKLEPNYIGSSVHKEKHPENHIFSFQEGWSGRLGDPISGGSSFMIKDSKRKYSRVKSQKLSFLKHNKVCDSQQSKDRRGKNSAAEKLSSPQGNTLGNSYYPMEDTELIHPKNGIQGKDSHPSPVIEMTSNLEIASTSQKNVDQRDDFASPSLNNSINDSDDHWSPTLKMNTPIKPSHGSVRQTSQDERNGHSPANGVFNVQKIRSFQSLLIPISDHCNIRTQVKSFDNACEKNSPVAKSVDIMEDIFTEKRDSESSIGASDSESSGNCSSDDSYKCKPSNHVKPEYFSPEVGMVKKPKFVFHPANRHHTQVSIEVKVTPTQHSPKGTEVRSNLQELSELDQEDGLASAIALFALALERVKSKMDSITSKKSGEILQSVAKEIHLQLQNAESQIQAQVGKLTSLGKTKRKRLENRFQEQQEQLKFINERFLQEVEQHIQNCRNTLEGLEACQMELKGDAEKQKALHRKLLLQVEESIETQLSDAQRKISTVQKLAREKMVQLKYVMAEFLKDDLLS